MSGIKIRKLILNLGRAKEMTNFISYIFQNKIHKNINTFLNN